jgi:hypothetical protein
MTQVRLQNKIGRTSLVGQIVKLAPQSNTAYILADTPDKDAIGTVAESVPNKYWGLVNLINTPDWDDILNKPAITNSVVVSPTEPPAPHVIGDIWIQTL